MDKRPPRPEGPPPVFSGRPRGYPERGGYVNNGPQSRHRPAPPREPPPQAMGSGEEYDRGNNTHRSYPSQYLGDFSRGGGEPSGRQFSGNREFPGAGERRPYDRGLQQGIHRGPAPQQQHGDSIHNHRQQRSYPPPPSHPPPSQPLSHESQFPSHRDGDRRPYAGYSEPRRGGFQDGRGVARGVYNPGNTFSGGPPRNGPPVAHSRKPAPPPPQGAPPPIYRQHSEGSRGQYSDRPNDERNRVQRSTSAPLPQNHGSIDRRDGDAVVEEGEVVMERIPAEGSSGGNDARSEEGEVMPTSSTNTGSSMDSVKHEIERPASETILGSDSTQSAKDRGGVTQASKAVAPSDAIEAPRRGATDGHARKVAGEADAEGGESIQKGVKSKRAKPSLEESEKRRGGAEDVYEERGPPTRKRTKDLPALDTALPMEDEEEDEDEEMATQRSKAKKLKKKKKKRVAGEHRKDDEEEETKEGTMVRVKKRSKFREDNGDGENDERHDELDEDTTAAGADLKSRRKSAAMDGDQTSSAAHGRAAKKRAAELIAKPKTPSSAAAGVAGLLSPALDKPEPAKRALSRQVTGGATTANNISKKRANAVIDDDAHSDLASPSPPASVSPWPSGVASAELVEQWWEGLREAFSQTQTNQMQTDGARVPPRMAAIAKRRQEEHKRALPPPAPPLYLNPRDAPGFIEREEWFAAHQDEVEALLSSTFILERNKARLGAEEYAHRSRTWRELKEQQRLMAEAQAQPQKHRYPSRNNPAAIAVELGHEHGAAEQARRERERRKNAAQAPDMEPRDLYLASVFARQRFLSLDGRPARCKGFSECLAANAPVPADLIVPSSIGCNCARAVAVSERDARKWTDAEKALFLDKFLQFPKDFQRIAVYLRDKSAEDCIAFYYDTKKRCDYKHYLAEHIKRRQKDVNELAQVREQYLLKLGVKLPLVPDLDACTSMAPFEQLAKATESEMASLEGPRVIFSRVDVFPKLPDHDLAAGIYPRPAWVSDDIDASAITSNDLATWLSTVS